MVHNLKSYIRPFLNFIRQDIIEAHYLGQVLEKLKNHELKNQEKGVKVLFNSPYPTSFAWIEYSLAKKLNQQGCELSFLVCDGLEYCEREIVTSSRPSCTNCIKHMTKQLKSFCLPYVTIGEFSKEEDLVEASKLTEKHTGNELLKYSENDIAIGEIAYKNLAHFFKGSFELKNQYEDKYKEIFRSAYVILKSTERYINKFRPDVLLTTNGKFIQTGIAVEICKRENIDYITWEIFNQFTSTVFAKNALALEQRVDPAWSKYKDIPLTLEQKKRINKNFEAQAKSENTPFEYQGQHYNKSQESLIQKFNLRKQDPLLVFFPNVEWDSTAMIDSDFQSMFDWIRCAIDFCLENPRFQLIVRAHPGEVKVPHDLISQSPICDRIKEVYPKLPQNIHLIGPVDPVCSYTLAEMAQVNSVYSSTMGIEFALRGYRPWVGSRTYYSGKGFSTDLLGRDHMVELLNTENFAKQLSPGEVELAERFAYMIRYRYLFSFPYIEKGKFNMAKYIREMDHEDEVIDNLCDLITGKREDYIDLGRPSWE